MAEVRPLVAEVEVAITAAPVMLCPAGPIERTPVFVTFPPEYERPEEKVVVEVHAGIPFRRARTYPPVPDEVVARALEPLPYRMVPDWMVGQPVPPLDTASVPVVSEIAIPREEVAMAVTFPAAPVVLPRRVLAAICAIFVRATPFVARARVESAPPTKEPIVPVVVNSAEGVKVVVATDESAFVPLPYMS